MDIANLAAFVSTDLVISATLIIQVSMALKAQAKRDLVALVWIWVGTMVLGFIAIPAAIPIFLTDAAGQVFTGSDGARLLAKPDTSPIWHYLQYALPALAVISGGMFLQGWSICKAE